MDDSPTELNWDNMNEAIDSILHSLYNGKLRYFEIDLIIAMIKRKNDIQQLVPVIKDMMFADIIGGLRPADAPQEKPSKTDAYK